MSTRRRRIESPWGPWEPFEPEAVAEALRGLAVPWWIAGGWALEAFVGHTWREHDDVDVGCFREDQEALREHLRGWDVHCADPPGSLRPWRGHERLDPAVHDVWVRESPDDPWRFQVMLDERRGGDWLFRRCRGVSRPVGSLTWERDGRRYLAPEVQLLYKARALRPKDRADFEHTLVRSSESQRRWLREALTTAHPGHEWLTRLS
jgi:hypothetical protein